MFHKLSFGHLLGVALALSFIMGFAVYVLSGATINKGTPAPSGPRRDDYEGGEGELFQVRQVRVHLDATKGWSARVRAGLQFGCVPARGGMRDNRRRLARLPIAGWLSSGRGLTTVPDLRAKCDPETSCAA